MSEYLRQFEPAISDDEEEYYEEEQYQQEELAEDVEEISQGVDLVSLASQQKQQKKKRNKKKKGKAVQTATSSKPEKPYTLEDELTPKTNMEARAFDEFEKYLTKPKKAVSRIHEQVVFAPSVHQCTRMYFDSIPMPRATLYERNPAYAKKYEKVEQELYVKSYKTHRYGRTPDVSEVKKLVVDESGIPIPQCLAKELPKSSPLIEKAFKKTNFASCTDGDKFILYGGSDGKTQDNGIFYIYDTAQNKLTLFADPMQTVHNIHRMVVVGRDLYLFYELSPQPTSQMGLDIKRWRSNSLYERGACESKQQMLVLFNYADPQESDYKKRVTVQHSSGYFKQDAAPAISRHCDSELPRIKEYSATALGNSGIIYLFGGRYSKALSTLYEVTAVDHVIVYKVREIAPPKQSEISEGNVVWPRPRYGHAAVSINGILFIYGGQDGIMFYNDMFMYHPSEKKWSEILVEGLIPRAVSNHSVCMVNNFMYSYGGSHRGNIVNVLNRFDFKTNKWYTVRVMGHGTHLDANPKSMQTPRFGHQLMMPSGTPNAYIIGGSDGSKVHSRPVLIGDITDVGEGVLLCQYLSAKREEKFMCDVVFALQEKGKVDLVYVFAHRAIIKARCAKLDEMIVAHSETRRAADFGIIGHYGENPTVALCNVADVSPIVFNAFVDFLYAANIKIEGKQNIEELIRVSNELSPADHGPMIKNICTSIELYLEVSDLVMEQLEKDLSKLVDNPDCYSDVSIASEAHDLGHIQPKMPSESSRPAESSLEQQNAEEAEEEGEVPFDDEENIEIPDIDNEYDEEEGQFSVAEPSNTAEATTVESSKPLTKRASSAAIPAHRLLLCRSPFFKSMLLSGMQESTSKQISLQCPEHIMLRVLKFLYTDLIEVSPESCIEMLIYCSMLQLNAITAYCRKMVHQLLSKDNIFVVLTVARNYSDQELQRICVRYVGKHFAELKPTPEYEALEEEVQHEIEKVAMRSKHKKKQ